MDKKYKIKNGADLLSKAIRIASSAFEGRIDKGGEPYILHCLWVMNKVRHLGHLHMICAVLHDLLEGTEWTAELLLKHDFPLQVVAVVELLTHNPSHAYQDYIGKLATNEVAVEIKKRDLEHNSKITRLKDLTKKEHDRMQKYHIAYTYLKAL